MTAFIRQEALEKAREIHLKADEEFAIEKSQLVRQETQSIDHQYEKKFKQASMSQQITKSTLSNKTRLRLLSARQQLLDDLFDQANSKLADSTNDQSKYQDILKNLILEGLYALNEHKVSVRCRSKDDDVVNKAADAAKAEYKEKMNGREVEVVIDEKEKLPEDAYVVAIHSILCNPSDSLQLWWCHHRQLNRQNRHQQHFRRAFASAPVRGSSQCESHPVWREQEQKIQGLISVLFSLSLFPFTSFAYLGIRSQRSLVDMPFLFLSCTQYTFLSS